MLPHGLLPFRLGTLGQSRFGLGCLTLIVLAVFGPAVGRGAQVTTAPSIMVEPADVTVSSGGTATFTATVAGSLPLTYQWKFAGQAIPNGTNATLTLTNVDSSAVGGYTLTATNVAGSATTRVATLAINQALVFSYQPFDQSIPAGGSLSLLVGVTVPGGATSPTWQIFVNGQAVPTMVRDFSTQSGSISATLASGPLGVGQSGSFYVVVTATEGTARSATRQLTVNQAPPVITSQPANLDVTVGESAKFTVVATGHDLAYQWRKEGVNINEATDATYEISETKTSDAGNYTCVISNSLQTILTATAKLTVSPPEAPTITSQPGNVINLAGGSGRLSVTARGLAPLAYQWARDGTDLPDATAATLQFAELKTSDAGRYTVTVSNSLGKATSAAARVTVVQYGQPTFILSPTDRTVNPGTTTTLAAVVRGNLPLTYQWAKDGRPLAGATASALTVSNFAAADAGAYTLTVSNAIGSATSAPANLKSGTSASPGLAPIFAYQPEDLTVRGQPGSLNSAVVEGVALTAQQADVAWSAIIAGETILPLNTLLIRTGNFVASTHYTALGDGVKVPYQLVATNEFGSVTSASHTVTVVSGLEVVPAPFSSTSLSSTAAPGQSVTLELVPRLHPGPVSFQWSKAGVAIPGATDRKFTLAAATATDAATYTLVETYTPVRDGVSTPAPGTWTFVLKVADGFPVITAQPEARSLEVGASGSLSVAATGPSPLGYQWYRNGTPLPGAKSATLALANVSAADAGVYYVLVATATALVVSNTAAVTVGPATSAAITTQPASATVAAGGSTTLSVVARGSGSLAYQWFKDGTALPGATAATLRLDAAGLATAGAYFVRVSNATGTVDSATVAVTVSNPPRLINLSLLTDLPAGDDFTLGFVTGGAGTSGSKPLLLRAAGPTLATFGVATAHSDPALELYRGSEKIAANDNWDADPGSRGGALFTAVGAFAYAAPTSKDAALLTSGLAGGSYSVRIAGATAATSGTVLAELYETTSAADTTSATPRLINVSVLKKLGAGLTVGFVVGGTGSKKILARAIGPGLAAFGVGDAATDPALLLKSAAGATLASNDNWLAADAATMTAVGAFALPAASKDAALVSTLSPGSYTLQVSAAGANSIGSVLVEVYEVP